MIEKQMETLKEKISKEVKTIKEFINLDRALQESKSKGDKKMILSHMELIKKNINSQQKEINDFLIKISILYFNGIYIIKRKAPKVLGA